MEKERSLESLLRDHNVSADQFFQQKGITAQIRNTNSMPRFLKYCKTHRNFTIRMLHIALNVSYEQLEDNIIKKAAHSITELLSNEESQLFQLFFETNSEEQSQPTEIPQQLDTGIRSEAQRLFRFDSDEQNTSDPEQPRSIEITGKEIVGFSFQILKNPEKNETCLGHLQKLYSFFIRHDPIPVLSYLQQNPEIINLLISNMSYSSVSSLLAQILTCEDKKKEYKYQNLKKNILFKVIESIFQRLQDQTYFDGALIFVQEILNTSKQTYYQYFQDFKRIAQYLGSSQVLNRFYNELLKLNQMSFSSCSKFLQSLFTRLNSQPQDPRYQQKVQQVSEMKFEVQIFVQNCTQLLKLISQIQSFNSLTKISFLSFLQGLLTSSYFKTVQLKLNESYLYNLFQTYKNENKGGIVKNKLYNLINKILSKSSKEALQDYIELHPNIYEQFFGVIKTANYNNTKIYNKNQISAFDISLIAQLSRKQQEALEKVSKILGKDMKRICKKYDTKLASFQNNPTFNLQQQFFSQFNESINKSESESGTGLTNFSLNLVGKNNIAIPLLQLPQKNKHLVEQPSEVKQFQKQLEISQKIQPPEIVQFQDVIVLTNKLDEFKQISQDKNESLPQKLIDQKQSSKSKEENLKNYQKQTSLFKQTHNVSSNDQKVTLSLKTNDSSKQKQQNLKKTTNNSPNEQKIKFYARYLTIYV